MKKRLYLWGLLLVWTPWLPTLIGLVIVFRGISSEKATGIAVLAGGLYELFLTIGVISTVVFQIVAIVLFARSFESGHWLRNAFSAISIFFSVFMLLLISVFIRLVWTRAAHGQ